jgi:fumarate reductase flavoprotein subunit
MKTPSFEKAPAEIPAKDIKETVNTDIVVAGAGPAGLAAAVSAAETNYKFRQERFLKFK